MSRIKALDELREYAEQCCPEYEDYDARMMKIADTIEAEFESCYMLLPVDADGVSIHVHDWIEVDDKKQRVEAIATNAVYWWEEDGCHWTQSFMCSLVKNGAILDIRQKVRSNDEPAHFNSCYRHSYRNSAFTGGEEMNREQAEHILDAYLSMYCTVKADGMHPDRDVAEASESLREVILDAMTNYKVVASPNITWPNTYPLTVPNVIHNKPTVIS